MANINRYVFSTKACSAAFYLAWQLVKIKDNGALLQALFCRGWAPCHWPFLSPVF
jgi:hypothetical protein